MTNTTPTTPATDVAPDAAMVATYAAASVGEKNRMRTAMRDAIAAAFGAGDYARVAVLIATERAFGPAAKSTVEVDYVAVIANMRATLSAAIMAIDGGTVTMPDGVAVPTYDGATLRAMDTTPDAAMVTRLTTVTGRKVGKGKVDPFIIAALATSDEPMSASDIHHAWTAVGASDDYPTEGPSVGAIGAAFVRVLDGNEKLSGGAYAVTTNAAGTRVATLS